MAVVQGDLYKLFTPPNFDLSVKYAFALNIIFVCLFYSSGMPLLLLFGFLGLLFMYWSEKYIVLKYSKKPPEYDSNLNKKVMRILPLSLILHLAISLFIYSEQTIFPKEKDGLLGSELDYLSGVTNAENSYNYTFSFVERG